MIRVENIHSHPDNPRKNIGDVSELAASIKEKGILQNLTVVPIPDEEVRLGSLKQNNGY